MESFCDELANKCTEIINNPAKNIEDIGKLLQNTENKETVYLALAKVFKRISLLYKIRLHSEKVKHMNGELKVSAYDGKLVAQYNSYVKQICSSECSASFRSACELLRSLDHFNFADRLVSKVLVGSNMASAIGELCIDTLADRIVNDSVGDSVFMILNQCLDYKCSYRVVEALLESKYLSRCVETRIDKEEKYNKERMEQKRLEKRSKRQKGYFDKNVIYGKPDRKVEKQRLIQQNVVKKEEDASLGFLEDKNYVRTVNALQRLYFTILKQNVCVSYRSTFIGLRKYIKLIRVEFREGLYVLLNDTIKDAAVLSKLEGILTILAIYGGSGLDFKRVIDIFYEILRPFNFELEIGAFEGVKVVLKQLFVDIKQPLARAYVFAQRIMHLRCMRHVPGAGELIKMLEVAYDIDFNDNDLKYKNMYDPSVSDVDKIECKPFYEYYLYKRII